MRYVVCWFRAPESDAPAIRSILTTMERKWEEWPFLNLPKVDGADVNTLEKLARPKNKRPKGSSRIGGVALDRSKMTFSPYTAVSRVTPEFLAALAALDDAGAAELGRAWAAAIEGVTEKAAIELVGKMADFVRIAAEEKCPVLELIMM